MYQLLAKYAAVQPMAVYSQSCGFLQKEYIMYFPGMKAVKLTRTCSYGIASGSYRSISRMHGRRNWHLRTVVVRQFGLQLALSLAADSQLAGDANYLITYGSSSLLSGVRAGDYGDSWQAGVKDR
jgi:hypothetical protein